MSEVAGQIRAAVEHVRRDRLAAIAEGKMGHQLEGADYLAVLRILLKQYTVRDVVTGLVEMYELPEIDVGTLGLGQQAALIGLLDDLFATDSCPAQVPLFLSHLRRALRQAAALYVAEALPWVHQQSEYNVLVSRLEGIANSPTLNVEQAIARTCNAYAALCEGPYDIAAAELAFAASILKGKHPKFHAVRLLPLIDKIQVVSSASSEVGRSLGEHYVPAIRNAAAHQEVDTSLLPIIVFRNRERGTDYRCSVADLYSKTHGLFATAQAVMTANTLLPAYPEWEPIAVGSPSAVDLSVDYRDILRRMEVITP